MKKSNQTASETYCIAIIDEKRIVTLNRKYLPNYSNDKIEGVWSDEYIKSLLSSSVTVENKNLSKVKSELSKLSTRTFIATQKYHNFEFFHIYNDCATSVEIKRIRTNISQILQNYTGYPLEFFE